MPGSGASIITNRLDPSGMLHRQGEADHVADVVGDEVGLVDPSAWSKPAMSSPWVFLS